MPVDKPSRVKIGVLCSPNCSSGRLAIDLGLIDVVVTTDPKAPILPYAKNAGVVAESFPYKSLKEGGEKGERARFEAFVTQLFEKHEVGLVLLIGYPYIASDSFIDRWINIYNTHPSLLPEYGGGYDLNVHKQILKDRKTVSGCTIHLVIKGKANIDGGPHFGQSKCRVNPDEDTEDTLKKRVQGLEEKLFMLLIATFTRNRNLSQDLMDGKIKPIILQPVDMLPANMGLAMFRALPIPKLLQNHAATGAKVAMGVAALGVIAGLRLNSI